MIIQAGGDLSRRLAPLSPRGKAFYSGNSVPLFPEGKAFPQSVKTFCFSGSAFESKRQKVFPLGELYHDFSVNLGEMPSPRDVVSTENKNGKEGLFQIENKRAISIKTNS